jgi:hypothetical protein
VAPQVVAGLARDRGERQRDERADDAVDLRSGEQREDHQQRVDAQRVAEDLRRDDMPLDLLQRDEQEPDPQRRERIGEQRDQHRRQGAEERADERHELHHGEEQREGEGVGPAVGEDPQHAEDVEPDPRAGAHRDAEQQLPAHVARDGALDAGRVVVLGGAVPGRHHPPHDGPDALAVEQPVDGQHEDEDEREAGGHDRREQVGPERHDVGGAADHPVAQGLQGGLALLGDLDVDALAVEVALQVVEVRVGRVHDPGDVVAEGRELVGGRRGQHRAGPAEHREERQDHQRDGHGARHPAALHDRHERVEDQRDHARDDEQPEDLAGGARQDPQREHGQRQHDELDPARDDDGRGHRRLGRRRRLGRAELVDGWLVGHLAPREAEYAP